MKFEERKAIFSKNLRYYREKAGFTQAQIAEEKLGMNPKAYSTYETGKNTPTFDKLLSLCEVLNTNPNALLGFEEIERFNTCCKHYGIEYSTEKKSIAKVRFTLRPQDNYQTMRVEKSIFFKILNELIEEFDTIPKDDDIKKLRETENKYFQALLQIRIGVAQIGIDKIIAGIQKSRETLKRLDDIVKRKNKTYKDVEKLQDKGLTYEQIIKKFEKE